MSELSAYLSLLFPPLYISMIIQCVYIDFKYMTCWYQILFSIFSSLQVIRTCNGGIFSHLLNIMIVAVFSIDIQTFIEETFQS